MLNFFHNLYPIYTNSRLSHRHVSNESLAQWDYHVIFGPDANCTLSECPIEWSVFQYRPSLAANAAFLALFALSTAFHVAVGIKWRSRWFMGCVTIGSILEAVGYAGRLIMYHDP